MNWDWIEKDDNNAYIITYPQHSNSSGPHWQGRQSGYAKLQLLLTAYFILEYSQYLSLIGLSRNSN
jgi:hypothetical protein